MRRPVLALALPALALACKRPAAPITSSADAGSVVAAAPSAMAGAQESPAIFSAPIAGARVAPGEVIAAGLVVATHTITAARIDAAGKARWTSALLPGVAWSADSELHAWPIAAGAVVVWRGPVGKKSGHAAVVVSSDGKVLDGPIDVGSLVCATSDGVAWSEGATGGTTRVHLRSYGSADAAAPHDETGPALHEDFTLTCGEHVAYAVVEGDEAIPTRAYAVGAGHGPAAFATIPTASLGVDEERDLFAWVDGDSLGLVQISNAGEVHAADVAASGVAPIRAEGARVAPEDDVVAVDADEDEVLLATTHDATDQCPNGRGGSSVHALRIARKGSRGATTTAIAPAACDKDVGPFWTNTLGGALVLGWAERASRRDKTSAPIAGIGFRATTDGAKTGRVAQAADAVADAACDAQRCYAVALVRPPGSDGMQPEAMKVLAYP
jgi:hypothetical protein